MKTPFSRFFKQAITHTQAYATHRASRRQFITAAATAAAAAAIMPRTLWGSTPTTTKRIAIVGAGLAGLNAAYTLQKRGIITTIYEATNRVGGRIYTQTNWAGAGIATELGGEFIDTTHTDLLALIQEFNLKTYDLRQPNQGNHYAFYFDDRLISITEVAEAIEPYTTRLLEDAYLAKTRPDIVVLLDKLSVTKYLELLGITGWLLDLITIMNTTEYGVDATEQSAMNLLMMLETPDENNINHKEYRLYGNTHEVLKVQGGNEQIPQNIAKRLQNPVKFNHKLQRLTQNDMGTYTLYFDYNGATQTIEADMVVLALPFTILRKIDLDIPLSNDKQLAINTLGYGNSAKIIMKFAQRRWKKLGYEGFTYSNLPYGCGWDSSQLQTTDDGGSFTVFAAAADAKALTTLTDAAAAANALSSLERIYPQMQQAYDNQTLKICWADNPYVLGGYSCYKVGQWATIAGFEGTAEDNVFFAGEHASANYQGYMNGAAESGRHVAEQILKRL